MTFEEEVVARIQQWGGSAGVEVTHCGIDNQPGDGRTAERLSPASTEPVALSALRATTGK